MKLNEHPTVVQYKTKQQAKGSQAETAVSQPLDAQWLRTICLEVGADDAGFVPLHHPAVADQHEAILQAYPKTKALISIVCRMNTEPVRSTLRSIANREFHTVGHDVDDISHAIVKELAAHKIGAVNPSMAFPMEMGRYPDQPVHVVSHKPIAEAAGMGVMGIHRNVIHPQFGNFILLGTILVGAEISEYGKRLDYNPCLECKLCVAACPVGAIAADGHFNAMACLNHNYREFFGGFVEWAEMLADSDNSADYRRDVTFSEDASRWQSLAHGANYKSAYCMAVCPAGEDVIGPFLDDKREFLNDVVKPFQQQEEVIYATPNSDAVAYVARRFPHKTVKLVAGGLQPQSIAGFVWGSQISFQREQSAGLDAVFHFSFTGNEERQVTFQIANKVLTVAEGLVGEADLHVQVDSDAWVKLINKRLHPVWAILRGKLRTKGNFRLLLHFQRCFG